jgi:kinetochore protein Spc7/SPC105
MAVVPSGAIAGQPNTFALPPPAPVVAASGRASTHGRRSSIQNLSAIGVNNENIGEGSMDMSIEDHTDSEEGGSEDGDRQVYMASNQSVYSNAETEAEEMSMEMTQNFGGGVIAHQGDESFRTESEANTSTRSDEEKTMEFTIAIGGFLPAAPPTGAQRGRASVGYSHIDPSGAFAQPIIPGEGDEMDMEMDETIAFGGIFNTNNVNVDDTISSTGSEDQNNQRDRTMTFSFGDLRSAAREEQTDMDMDMTTVGGGIFSQPQQQQRQNIFATTTPAAAPRSPRAPVQNIFAPSTSTSTVAPKSPRPQPNIFSTSTTPKSPRLPTLTHPTSSTPSFARPTASSASKSKTKSPEKEKRDIYGPSPSPAKSATPRKSGMQTASEVAKRLSFGSSAGGSVHGSAKRSRIDEFDQENQNEQEGSVKKQKIGLGDSIFGRPRQSLALGGVQQSPIRALPTLAGSGGTAASARSPARPRQSVAIPTITIQPEAEHHEEEEERGEDWEPPVIGLSTFLEMAGVQFVDRLPSMARRKSAGKSLGANYRGKMSLSEP